VDNTADANKPVSTAVRGAIDAEVLAREGADIALNTKIESYIGKTERITSYAFSFQTFTYDDPTEYQAQQEELTTCALSYFGFTEISDIPNAVGVHNLNGGHLFIFNQEQEDPPIPASWVDDGLDTVAQATNNTLGVVKGSVEELEI
jgi:hypothetical protein